MQYGLIGERLGHSFSKEIHAKIAPYSYELRELSPEQLPEFMKKKDFLGINVTIPYKKDVIPFLDCIDEGARLIGAVNTVVNRDGKLYGYNTDFVGMSELILKNGWEMTNKSVLILGTGGTSFTAQAVCRSLSAGKITVAGRKKGENNISYEEAYSNCADYEYIINTTPCGMYPYPDGNENISASPIDISKFPNLRGIVDAVYNPLRTNFILEGKKRGISSEGGLYMLVCQAIAASEHFTGEKMTPSEKKRIAREIEAEKENIVLIGMAGCGKTTVGKKLAKELCRVFIDTDEQIVKETGKPIPQIFSEIGEEGFRKIEAETVQRIASSVTGAIISTGGGVILNEKNIQSLKRNGRIYFLNRPIDTIVPTEDRPLSSDRTALVKLFNSRYEKYCVSMDVEITDFSSVSATANEIRKDFFHEIDDIERT